MKEVFRTANPVMLSIMQNILDEKNIETLVLDAHASALFPGVGAMESRLMVVDDQDYDRAVKILSESGFNQ